jgi:putative ABC transport system permease protein
MSALSTLRRRLTALLRRSQIDRDLEEEMRLHVELRARQLEAAGLAPEASQTAARRRFGNLRRLREESVDSWGWRWLEQLAQDARFAGRTLLRHPGYALTAIVTLGLGIGANTAIFSVLNGVVLKPLPYTDGERLVVIGQSAPGRSIANAGLSVREFRDYRDRAQSFDALVEYHQMFFDLLRRGDPDRVDVGVVSHDFFDVLGITPILGRSFRPPDDVRGADAVLLLGYAYWMEKFGGDPAIVGQVVEMNDRPHRVIGVLPDVPHYPQENDVYMPVAACPFRAAAEDPAQGRRFFTLLRAFGRLKAGVGAAQAEREVEALCGRSNAEHPDAYGDGLALTATARSVRDELVRPARPLLWLLLGTTGLVLLIACANVANLSIARLLRRDRELGLREALGAGRGRMVRQLLTESSLLSLLAGGTGLLVAASTISLLTAFVEPLTPRAGEIAIDGRVLVFTIAVSMATGLLSGTVPALLSRLDPGAIVRAGRAVETAARRRLQGALVVAQVAVAVMLLAGAGLLLASVYRLQRVDVGFDAEPVVTAETVLTFGRISTPERFIGLYESVVERLHAEPGITAAAVTSHVPLSSTQQIGVPYRLEGIAPGDRERAGTSVAVITPRYFEALGAGPLDGRAFDDRDDGSAARVAIVNRTLARQFGPRSAVGARLTVGSEPTPRTIVGVASDVRQLRLDDAPPPLIYIPLRQTPMSFDAHVLVRTSGGRDRAAAAIRRVVRAVDADMPVENVASIDELRGSHLTRPQLTAMLLSVFAALALAVTLTGIAGLMAMHVAQRRKEFGVRLALGASRGQILAPVLRSGLTLVSAGLLLGLTVSAALTRVLSPYLFDTTPTDPAAFAGVAIALLVTGGLACLAPAWRATRVDPQVVFRTD